MTFGTESDSRGMLAHWPIAALRVYTGIFFLIYGYGKVKRGGSFADSVAGFVQSKLDGSFEFYRGFLESVVIPNKGLFAVLVGWGELFLGIALILGVATRYAAFAGAFMVASFWFAKGQGFFDAQNHDAIWLVILLVLGFIPAGRIYGLDGKLSQRFPLLR